MRSKFLCEQNKKEKLERISFDYRRGKHRASGNRTHDGNSISSYIEHFLWQMVTCVLGHFNMKRKRPQATNQPKYVCNANEVNLNIFPKNINKSNKINTLKSNST